MYKMFKFHVKLILLSLLLCFHQSTFSQGVLTLQDKPFLYNHSIDSSLWAQLSTDPQFNITSKAEQMMFYWTNYFRQNPKRFYNTMVKEFIKQFPEANTDEVKSLEKDITKLAVTLPICLPDKGLIKMAGQHSSDLMKRGNVISHKSSTGKDFVQRIKETGFYRCGAENIYTGTFDPLEALIALLVDYGVPDKGHRMNLLDPRFGKMGISFPSSTPKKGLLVQVFACL